MNKVKLHGVIKDITHSHDIGNISFDKAKLIVKRPSATEDIINLRFKTFSNRYKDNDEISIEGNIRSYSYRISEDRNKVLIYVFTYFDEPEDFSDSNVAELDGRICKINSIRTNKSGKHNIHFI